MGRRLSHPLLQRARLVAVVALVAVLISAGCAAPTPAPAPAGTPEPPASYAALARYYAPIIRQGAASDQDYITAVDFDGDWVGDNNWPNLPAGDLAAHVYYSLIETDSHWFLFYSLFHPRDYTAEPCAESDGCHENDMESLEVVVARDHTAYGRPVALLTLAHSHIYLYSVDDAVARGALKVRGKVTLEGSHPVVWVETYGHGIYGVPQALAPGTIVYKVSDSAAGQAETPAGIAADNVLYRLVSIYDPLWQHRAEIGSGRLFDQPFDYRGHALPASFDGDDWGEDKANSPWGYNQEIGLALTRGDFLLDPAKAFAHFATIEGELSQNYLYNPFLDDLR